jgi:hypothetical protein
MTTAGPYWVYAGIDQIESGITMPNLKPLSDYLTTPAYVDAINRIEDMKHPQRSGDIVLIMKDATPGDAVDRYSTAYACKSWHGSLNSSDSYVPLIVSYPGGNGKEVEKTMQTEAVCKSDYSSCNNNWKVPVIVREIISSQFNQ